MRHFSITLICGFLAACAVRPDAGGFPAAGADPASEKEMNKIFDLPYLMRDLDNGLRVIVVQTDYPDVVSLQIPVQTGSRNEVEPGKSGFAHFFEHMMFRGTKKYPADAYSDILKNAGADQNAYTTDDYTNYHLTFIKDDLEKMLEIEADRFRNLSYSEDVFRTEALAVKGEYLKNYSDPSTKAYERMRELAFTTHTYRHTTMGFAEDIDRMPEQYEYSKTFFERWYRPEKTAIIVVGDVDPERTFDLVKKHWSDWERGDYSAEIPVEPPPEGPVYDHIEWEAPTQPWLLIGFRGPAYDPGAKNMPAMDLLSAIYFSESSDLYQDLVIDRQMVDQLFTYFPDRKDPNLLMIYARLTDENHAAEVQQAIHNTVAVARTTLADREKVDATKSRLRYSFASQLDRSSGIGAVLAAYVQFARTPETVNKVYETYARLTAEDIRHYANEYFVDDNRVTVSLSASSAMAGIDEDASIDALVAAMPATDESVGAADGRGSSASTELRRPRAPSPVRPRSITLPSASAPLVDLSVIVHAGAAMDPPGKKGLAALTAAMITEGGSEFRSIREINEAMYPMAAGFDAQVDKEMTRLAGQVHRDNLDAWYALVREQLLYPGWREQDFRRLKTTLINEIRSGLVGNNDEELGKEMLYSEIYGPEHPYGSLNMGHVDDVESLTLDDVKRFYREHYTPANVTVGLAGGFGPQYAETVLADLATLPRGERQALLVPSALPLESGRALIVQKETPAVAVSFGFPIEVVRGDPDWVALWLARSWLGEHRSTNSHLFKRIRELRGMNYGDYAYIEYFPRGMFQFHPDTNLARQQQLFQVWLRPLRNNNDAHFATRTAVYELQKLVEKGLSREEFEATRNYLQKFVSLLTDGQSRQLGYAIDDDYYGIDNFADYVRAGLQALTLDQVNRAIRAHLRVERMQYVFVTRDADELRERLVSDRPSPVSYDATMPPEVLQEDAVIAELPLQLDAKNVRVVEAERVFR